MKYYAGIDLGGTYIKVGILDENGKILIKDKTPTPKNRLPEDISNEMSNLISQLMKKTGVDIESVGIGTPGLVNNKTGEVFFSNNLAWSKVPIAKLLQNKINVPVFACNDASAAALGEYFCGASKSYKNSVLLTLGTGVGSGIIIEGKLFEGVKSAGGELGHTLLKINGNKCSCGRRGCYETYASATALINQAKEQMKKDILKTSILWSFCNDDENNVDGEKIANAVKANDKLAKKIWNRYTTYVAEGIINIANALRPDIVLIGGGVSSAGDLLLSPINRKINKALKISIKYAPVKVDIASLQNDAGICGAVKFAIDSSHNI